MSISVTTTTIQEEKTGKINMEVSVTQKDPTDVEKAVASKLYEMAKQAVEMIVETVEKQSAQSEDQKPESSIVTPSNIIVP